MATILQIVDKADPTTMLMDLNELSATQALVGGFMLVDNGFDLGDVMTEVEWLQSADSAGADAVKVNLPPARMSLTLLAKDSSLETLTARIRELHKHLVQGGLLRWRADGMTEDRYITFYPSPIPALLREETDNYLHVVGMFQDPGFRLEILRHPYLSAPLDAPQTFAITMDAVGRELILQNPGNAPSPMLVTVVPGGPTPEVVELKMGRRSRGNPEALRLVYGFEVEGGSVTRSNSTSVVTDGSRTVAQTTFATIPWLRRRWRRTLTVPNANDIAGRWRVLAVVRTVTAGVHGLQLRWADGDRDPAEISNALVEYDTSDIQGVTHYTEVDLGTIQVTGPTVTLEGWAKWEEGGLLLNWDHIILVPADERYLRAGVAGFFGASSNRTTYHGRELTNISGAAANKEDDRVLNTNGDICASPGGYQVLPAGRHTFEVHASIRNPNEGKARIGVLEVRDQNGLLVDSVALQGKKDKLLSKRTKSVTFDATGAMGYRAEVRHTSSIAGSRITVHKLHHAYQRFAGAADALVLDGPQRKAYLRSGSGRVSELIVRGGMPEAAPGPNFLVISLGDVIGTGYHDVVEKEPLAKHTPERSAQVTIQLQRRYTT